MSTLKDKTAKLYKASSCTFSSVFISEALKKALLAGNNLVNF